MKKMNKNHFIRKIGTTLKEFLLYPQQVTIINMLFGLF